MDRTIRWVYVTASDADEAQSIGRAVVGERLAACANVLPQMTSIYRWEGALQEDSEAVLIMKTTADLFAALEARVRELHSYEVPCIVALDVVAVSAPYLEWLVGQTTGSA